MVLRMFDTQRHLMTWSLFSFLVLICLGWVRAVYDVTQASNIASAILSGYQTSQRPTNQVSVSMGFGINHLSNLVGLVWLIVYASVNSYGHVETVSLSDHNFSWASLTKRLTISSCKYFRLCLTTTLFESAEGTE